MKSLKKKKYKALILDVDGTTIPNQQDGLPSPRVTSAIRLAQQKLHVCLASGRPYNALNHIVKHLKLTGPVVANGGARVVDTKTEKVLWEQSIDKNDAIQVGEILLHELKLPCFVNDDGIDVIFSDSYIPKNPLEMCVQRITPDTAEIARKQLSKISGIILHTTYSWEKEKVDILINHASATKQHGILEVAKILNINTQDMIGIGDSGNDFPLLMACGLKVAMGNATKDLKAIADYIAPSVQEDGVADVIEKFVL